MDPLRFVPSVTNFRSLAQIVEGNGVRKLERANATKLENEARNYLEAREGTNDVSDASVREFLGDGRHAKLMTARDPQHSVAQLRRAASTAPTGHPASLGSIDPDEMGTILAQVWKNAGA